jgi:hypothetical protein
MHSECDANASHFRSNCTVIAQRLEFALKSLCEHSEITANETRRRKELNGLKSHSNSIKRGQEMPNLDITVLIALEPKSAHYQ